MKTKAVFDADGIREAGHALRDGALVAFPTETVYGLGANALNEEAVASIFKVKGRPLDNPLIVHVLDVAQAERYALEIPDRAYKLWEAFCPGPLTLVLKRAKSLPSMISAGLETVAIRLPAHQTARALLEAADCPVVAPSANRSGKPSPTRMEDVLEDLAGAIPYVVEGAIPDYGLESTVLDLTSKTPCILRPGAVTQEMLEAILGLSLAHQSNSETPKAPGMKYRHYAPKAEVLIVRKDAPLEALQDLGPSAFLWPRAHAQALPASSFVFLYDSVEEASHQLFAFFREADRRGMPRLVLAQEGKGGAGAAYMNRVYKAAGLTEGLLSL